MGKYSHKSQELDNALGCDVILTFNDGTIHEGHLTDEHGVMAHYNIAYTHAPYYLLSFCESGAFRMYTGCLGFYKSIVKKVNVKRRFKQEER